MTLTFIVIDSVLAFCLCLEIAVVSRPTCMYIIDRVPTIQKEKSANYAIKIRQIKIAEASFGYKTVSKDIKDHETQELALYQYQYHIIYYYICTHSPLTLFTSTRIFITLQYTISVAVAVVLAPFQSTVPDQSINQSIINQ